MHRLVCQQLGDKTQFILTGGDGKSLDALLPGRFKLCPELVLLGLAAVAGEAP